MIPYSKNIPTKTMAQPNGYSLPYLLNRKNGLNRSQMQPESAQTLRDYGPYPFSVNLEDVTKKNSNYRTALWTGNHLQLTLMDIPVGGEIGLEMHDYLDQFIYIVSGKGLVLMGDSKDVPNFQQGIGERYGFIVPAGKWHNLINVGQSPIKLFSIYGPPEHPFGTLQPTKADADAEEAHE